MTGSSAKKSKKDRKGKQKDYNPATVQLSTDHKVSFIYLSSRTNVTCLFVCIKDRSIKCKDTKQGPQCTGKTGKMAKRNSLPISFVYVKVTNHVNWHRGGMRLDRVNTGKLKMEFEWGPCKSCVSSCHWSTTIE